MEGTGLLTVQDPDVPGRTVASLDLIMSSFVQNVCVFLC